MSLLVAGMWSSRTFHRSPISPAQPPKALTAPEEPAAIHQLDSEEVANSEAEPKQAKPASEGAGTSLVSKSEKSHLQTRTVLDRPEVGEGAASNEEAEAARGMQTFTGTYALGPLSKPAPEGGHASAMGARDAMPLASDERGRRVEDRDDARWRVGEKGLIQRADACGKWETVISGVEIDLFDVSFATASTGWVVGAVGTVLRTTDGGNTWTRVSTPAEDDLIRIRAFSPLAANVVTRGGRAFTTSDGGKTWQQLRLE
jgi:hypothetical protein